jgi:Trk-type K+ transport system membrane component
MIIALFVDLRYRAFPLLITGLLILAGNTLFPCLLRLSIWVIRKMIPEKPTWQPWRRVFDLTLAHSQDVGRFRLSIES